MPQRAQRLRCKSQLLACFWGVWLERAAVKAGGEAEHSPGCKEDSLGSPCPAAPGMGHTRSACLQPGRFKGPRLVSRPSWLWLRLGFQPAVFRAQLPVFQAGWMHNAPVLAHPTCGPCTIQRLVTQSLPRAAAILVPLKLTTCSNMAACVTRCKTQCNKQGQHHLVRYGMQRAAVEAAATCHRLRNPSDAARSCLAGWLEPHQSRSALHQGRGGGGLVPARVGGWCWRWCGSGREARKGGVGARSGRAASSNPSHDE